ncbi:MAG: hypothetical protein JJ885_15285, partial [Muricauda sp.]
IKSGQSICHGQFHPAKVGQFTRLIQVESEKTAIVMSILSDKTTWMACGSKTAINEKMLEPLKDNAIILFPDKGSAGEWQQRVDKLIPKGFNIQVSRFLENEVELEDGKDIADLYLR